MKKNRISNKINGLLKTLSRALIGMEDTLGAKYTLYYLDFNDRGEPIRRMFHFKKVDFVDKRISFDEWPSIKLGPKFKFGQIPVLEFSDGSLLTQSYAIMKYIAAEYDFDGNTSIEKARCDELVFALYDLQPKASIVRLGNPNEKEKNIKDFKEIHYPKFLEHFEKLYSKSNGIFLIGDKMTYADVFLSTFLDTYEEFIGEELPIPSSALKVNKMHQEVLRLLKQQ